MMRLFYFFTYACVLVVGVSEALVPRAINSRATVHYQQPPTRTFSSSILALNARENGDEDDDDGLIVGGSSNSDDANRRNLLINTIAGGLLAASGLAAWQLFQLEVYTPTGFRRLPTTQFLAALGDPTAREGTGAESWGLWRQDPGPRGVWLRDYEPVLVQNNGIAPRGWKFDENDFWIEEHGLIMESPDFPLKPGRYLVTGARSVTTGLTVEPNGQWKLDEGTLYDVTHLPCRSARYNPINPQQQGVGGGSPAAANPKDFPVKPGAAMPNIPGTSKQDYAVLFVIGKAV